MLKISQQTTIKLIVAINTLANLHFFISRPCLSPTPRLSTPATFPGTLPRAKERRTVAFLTALRTAALFEYLRRCTRSCLLKIEQQKKRPTLSCKAFFGAPSVGALRIQSCGLNLATSPRETNTSACAKCESVPEGMVQQKSRNIRCGFSWCTIGDSNPGPTD